MIKIKFDGVEIDGNAFAKISKSGKVYDKNFKLGSTICETYKMQVNKENVNSIPSVVEIYNKGDKITGNNNIILENISKNSFLECDINGVCSQDGTPTPSSPVEVKTIPSIINLINPNKTINSNGVISNYNQNQSLSFNGTLTKTWAYITDKINIVLKSGNYTFSINKSVSSHSCVIRLFYDSTNYKDITIGKNNLYATSNIPNDVVAYQIYISNLTIGDEVNDTLYFQLEEGSVAHEYIPYGYYTRLKITNEDGTQENQVLIDMSKENLKKNPTILNGFMSDGGTLNSSNVWRTLYIECQPSTTYTVCKVKGYAFRVGDFQNVPNFGDRYINRIKSDANTFITFTTSSNSNYLAVTYYYSSSDTLTEQEILNSIQIFKGISPTPYYELCKIGDYKDTLSIDSSGNCIINKNIGKVVLNGNETWELQWNQSGFRTSIPNLKQITSSSQNSYAISNYYESGTTDEVFASNYGICNRVNQSQIIIKNVDSSANVNTFKTWLTSHNTDVYYVLDTPETITLSNTKIPLYEGVNNIYLVDDLVTTVSVNTSKKEKTLYVTDYNDEDDFVYELSLEDSMTKFNFRYDASEIFVDDHTTLLAIFEDICEKAGVDTDINTFYGSTMQIGVYDNTYMARDYLGYIAEINGKNLRISADDKLEFVDINTTPVETIDFEDISKFKIGVQHTITRVVLGDWKFGDETGETYYINEDNPYATSQTIVEHIYNEINGFTYYNFKTNDCPMTDLELGDLVKFTYNEDEYVTFVQYEDINFSGGEWFGGIEVNLDSPVKQETQIVGEADKFRRIKRIVDQETGTIQEIIEEQGQQGIRMSQIEQSLDQIESQIVDIPTITTENSGTGSLYLNNLAGTKLIQLKIHPTDRDIIGLFASPLLKVASGLKALSRGVTFDNTNGTESDLYYKLPDNLYYYNSSIYDEFVYDGKEEKIYVIRKVAVDEQGNKSALAEPITEEYEYTDLVIAEGDYNVFMSTYPTAYIYIKAMIKNDYTDLFATTYELDSSIKQTASSIGLSVDEFKDGEKVNGALILAQINNDESEAKIKADKIKLEGYTTINDNFTIDEDGKMTCTDAKIRGGDIQLYGGTASNPTFMIRGQDSPTRYSMMSPTLLAQVYVNEPNINQTGNGISVTDDSASFYSYTNAYSAYINTFSNSYTSPKGEIIIEKNNNYNTKIVVEENQSGIYVKRQNNEFNIILNDNGSVQLQMYNANGSQTIIDAGQIYLKDSNGNTKTITPTS